MKGGITMVDNWLKLDGKKVIVTGGASGIGLAISKELKANGAQVIVVDLNVETGMEDGIFNIQTDVTSTESIEEMIETVKNEFNQVDVLVNNAGINMPRILVDYYSDERQFEIDEEAFDKITAVNQKGVVLTTQAVVRLMLETDVKGKIINISSESGQEGSIGQSLYAASKNAINSYTRSWAKELGEFGIQVVGVAPGINEETGLTTDEYNEALAYTRNISVGALGSGYTDSIPLGRVGKLAEIAYLVAFLSSNNADYITGTTINITGGKSRG